MALHLLENCCVVFNQFFHGSPVFFVLFFNILNVFRKSDESHDEKEREEAFFMMRMR